MSTQTRQIIDDFKALFQRWKKSPTVFIILDILSLAGILAFLFLLVAVYAFDTPRTTGNMAIVILPALLAGITMFTRSQVTENPESINKAVKELLVFSTIIIGLTLYIVFGYKV